MHIKDRMAQRRAAHAGAPIVSLDPGSQTIKALMATIAPDGALTFLAGGEFPSEGIHAGMVNAPAQASMALAAALDELEAASQTRILSAMVSVGGAHARSQMTRATTAITRPDHEIGYADVERVIAAARQTAGADERSEQLHVIPRGYTIDGIAGIPDPLGMVGFELAAQTCVVTAPLAVTQNLARTLERAGAAPDGLTAGPLAAGESVRSQGADGLPLAVVDIGAQTTGLTLYADGAIWQCACLPHGADAITRRIAQTLRLPLDAAETLKRRYGACLPGTLDEDELIELEPITESDELLPARLLAECAEAGARDLIAALLPPLQEARRQGVTPALILLTGGGAELAGFDALLTDTLKIPAQVARPTGLVGVPPVLARPAFAVATGLLLLGARQRMRAAHPASHAPRGTWRSPSSQPAAKITAALGRIATTLGLAGGVPRWIG